MKLRLTLMIVALAVSASGATAQSGPTGIPSVAQYQYRVDGVATGARTPGTVTDGSLWRIRVLALRHEALDLQRRDGGTLTREHHAMLQAKLDRINAQAQQH